MVMTVITVMIVTIRITVIILVTVSIAFVCESSKSSKRDDNRNESNCSYENT